MHKYDQIFDWYLSSRNNETDVHSVKFAFKGLSPGSKIFDMGCGTGLPLARTLEQMEMNIIGVDSSDLMVQSFKSNFPEAEAHHLPMQDYVFPNTEIGGVLCWGC
ncbi:MAG: methyltransferase domain-containing protein, partial [Gammaproteobacteria bacterium]